ncbi:DUF5300 family protein [Blautia sp. MSJ-9]|uniref:DUF5300 family protein n=1 Tax=Blautia sp. MSJ-9 TaxID=2841511 RepID=UPI001C109260|nr:DUF5300 family protein [Blautia sp. MSJ-9]MBU5680642.1 hypothetical protein [Blautia sp. MSJ-9]
MKITAYEVREDETEIMKKLADKLGIDELVTTAEPLTLDTAHLAKGAAVIKNLSGFGCKILAHSRHEDEQIGALALDVFENENGIYHHDRKTDIIKNKELYGSFTGLINNDTCFTVYLDEDMTLGMNSNIVNE